MEQNNEIETLPVGKSVVIDNATLQSIPSELQFLTLAELEKNHINTVLSAVGGSKTKAAKILGVSVKTMYNKLAEYEKTSQVVRNNP